MLADASHPFCLVAPVLNIQNLDSADVLRAECRFLATRRGQKPLWTTLPQCFTVGAMANFKLFVAPTTAERCANRIGSLMCNVLPASVVWCQQKHDHRTLKSEFGSFAPLLNFVHEFREVFL